MSPRDYYDTLGVEREATMEQIKKSYRQLALRFHPDRNPGDHEAEERFKEATEAYEVLSHPEKRGRYDRFGHAGLGGAAASGFDMEFNLHDAMRAFMRDFGEMFGATGTSTTAPDQGADRQLRLPVTLAEAATGVKRKIRIRRSVRCTACEGHGTADGGEPAACAVCNGQGKVRRIQRSLFGQFVSVGICPQCAGTGKAITDPCPGCGGDGRVEGRAELEVEIPPGVDTGDYLTLRGEGDAGPRGGTPGNMIVILDVEDLPGFERHGRDLLIELPIGPAQAALGGKVEVPTLDGSATLTIPAGVQHDTLLRLKGKGLPPLRGGPRGHQFVRVRIAVPESLSRRQEDIYKKLLDLERRSGAE